MVPLWSYVALPVVTVDPWLFSYGTVVGYGVVRSVTRDLWFFLLVVRKLVLILMCVLCEWCHPSRIILLKPLRYPMLIESSD